MYKENDYIEVNISLRNFTLIYITATLLMITVVVLTCINWGDEIDPVRMSPWFSYVICGLWSVGTVFSWGVIGSRIIKYRRFLYDIKAGLDRDVEGVITEMSKDQFYKQGIEFYSLVIDEAGKEADESGRLLYYDVAKGEPPFNVGDRISVNVFGNYIKAIY